MYDKKSLSYQPDNKLDLINRVIPRTLKDFNLNNREHSIYFVLAYY